MEKILDDQLTDAVMSGRTTPETAEWWRLLPYSGDKAREWYDRQQPKWHDVNAVARTTKCITREE